MPTIVSAADVSALSSREISPPRETRFGPAARRLAPWLGFFALALVGANLWFAKYNFRTVTGDDLATWSYEHALHGWSAGLRNAFVGTAYAKYRPFAALVLLAGYHAFGSFYAGYKDLNLVIEAVNLTLFGYLAWLLSGSRLLAVGLTAVALATTSDLYYILQTFGAAEGLCLTFMLLFLIASRKAIRGSSAAMIGANLAYFGAIYTHERYLAMGPALVLLPLLATRSARPWRRDLTWRVGWIAAPVAVAASNVIVKAVLGVHFLTGTGGTNISFSLSQALSFFSQGAKTLIGFDSGPDYLAGASWPELPHSEGAIFGAWFAAVVVISLLVAVIRRLRHTRSLGWAERLVLVRVPILGVVLGALMLAVACTTVNLQYRWLYTPYIVLLLGVAWAAGCWRPEAPAKDRMRTRGRSAARPVLWVGACVVAVCAGLGVQVVYRPYAENTYFFSAQSTADSVYQQVFVDNASRLSTTTFLVDTTGNTTMQYWILGEGSFFTTYADGRKLDVRLITSVPAAAQQLHLRKHVVLLVWNGNNAVVPTPLPH